MGNHHHIRVVQIVYKGYKLCGEELVPGLLYGNIAVMGVTHRVPVAGEVLYTAQHFGGMEAFQLRRHHFGHQLRVAAEGPVADDHIVRVGIGIRHRGKVQVEAVFRQIAAYGEAYGSGGAGISRGAYLRHALELGQHIALLRPEGRRVCQAGHGAALLVHAHEQGQGAGLLHCGYKVFKLLRGTDVLAEDGHAPRRILLQLEGHILRPLRHPVLRGVMGLPGRQGRGEGFRANYEQLAHLFLQAHGAKQRLHFGDGLRCWFRRGRGCLGCSGDLRRRRGRRLRLVRSRTGGAARQQHQTQSQGGYSEQFHACLAFFHLHALTFSAVSAGNLFASIYCTHCFLTFLPHGQKQKGRKRPFMPIYSFLSP